MHRIYRKKFPYGLDRPLILRHFDFISVSVNEWQRVRLSHTTISAKSKTAVALRVAPDIRDLKARVQGFEFGV